MLASTKELATSLREFFTDVKNARNTCICHNCHRKYVADKTNLDNHTFCSLECIMEFIKRLAPRD